MNITQVMRLSERIFKMDSPLTGELYQAGEYEYEDSIDEYNGEELLPYAKDIEKAVAAYTDNGTEDLMKYFYESEYIKKHVLSLVPSVEVWNGRLYGCTTVRADEDLSEPGWDKLMDYLTGQYSDGWDEGFAQREIETEDGLLYVHFWQDHDFNFTVEEVTPSKKYEITDIEHPKDPSLHRIRALRRVSETVGPGTLGGYVQSEENLSQENDGAWIYGEAICCESAIVAKGGIPDCPCPGERFCADLRRSRDWRLCPRTGSCYCDGRYSSGKCTGLRRSCCTQKCLHGICTPRGRARHRDGYRGRCRLPGSGCLYPAGKHSG